MPTNFPTALDDFINPNPTDKLNSVTVPHAQQHQNNNDAIEAIEAKVGINFSTVQSTVDYGLKLLFATQTEYPSGSVRDITPIGDPFPTNVVWYQDAGKTIKLVDKTYTYGPGTKKFITSIVYRIFDGTVSNTILRTITDTITLSGPFETTRTRVVT